MCLLCYMHTFTAFRDIFGHSSNQIKMHAGCFLAVIYLQFEVECTADTVCLWMMLHYIVTKSVPGSAYFSPFFCMKLIFLSLSYPSFLTLC